MLPVLLDEQVQLHTAVQSTFVDGHLHEVHFERLSFLHLHFKLMSFLQLKLSSGKEVQMGFQFDSEHSHPKTDGDGSCGLF